MAPVLFPERCATGLPPELVMEVAGLTIRGTSVAARATALAVPELSVALDVGRLTPAIVAQPVVLLSHAHLDHMAALLAYLNVRARFHRDVVPAVYCPEEVASPLVRALELLPGMSSVHKRLKVAEVIRGVAAGQEVPLPCGVAVPFAMDHEVPTLGWSLRRDARARPDLVFAMDGAVEPFRAAPELLDARVAIVECSFLERNRRVAAHLARHAHLRDWIEVAPALRCDTLVLAHLPPGEGAVLAAQAAPLADAFSGALAVWAGPPEDFPARSPGASP